MTSAAAAVHLELLLMQTQQRILAATRRGTGSMRMRYGM